MLKKKKRTASGLPPRRQRPLRIRAAPMQNRRRYPRIPTEQEVDLQLHDLSGNARLTGRVPALLTDLSRQGAGLKLPRILVDGSHLFYTALDSETTFLEIVFRATDDPPETTPPLLARPIWLNRDMEDCAMPFRMGVQFIDEIPSAVFSRLLQG